MRRKIFSFVVVLCIVLNLCSGFGTVFAQSAVVFDITAEETVYPGKTVTVTVSADISAGTDVQGIQADFAYSEGFPEISAEITENTTGWTNVGLKKKNLLGVGYAVTSDSILKGTISFDVPQDATIGTVYTIGFDDLTASTALGDVEYSTVNSSVSITVVDFPEIDGVQIDGYEGVYDGQEHTLSVQIPEGAKIKYSTDGEIYSEEAIGYADVCDNQVSYVVSMDEHKDKTGIASIKITQKDVSESMIASITSQEYTGNQIKPSITVTDGNPSIITASDYDISYGENKNVSTGGSVTITGKGNYKGTATKTFAISKATMTADTSNYTGTYDGQAHKASVSITKPETATIKYGTADGTYNLDTMLEYTNAGTYTVYFKATAENYSDYTGSVTVTINQKEVTESMIASITSQEYTGNQIKPSITVTDGNPSIITSSDYEVSYGENKNVSTGGSVTITGKGNYKGTATKTFSISPVDMTVDTSNYTGTYDGQAHKASVSTTVPTSATIKYGTVNGTYNLNSMPEYKNAGTYTVYFKATAANYNDYTGSVIVTVNQKDVSESMIASITAQEYTGNQIKPSITVTDGNPSIITSSDYDISYGENKNVSTGGSVTITGKGNYKGTATKTFEISKATMTADTSNYTGTYDGQAHKASVSITKPETATIKYGTADGTYNLDTMPEYKNAGTYTVYFKATAENYSDYTGSVTVTITQKEVTESMIASITSQEYTGNQIKPSITVTDGNPSIITSSDYDISYGENKNVSTGGSVTITGKGNYKGTATKTFEISKATMTADTSNYTGTYDGQSHKASVSTTVPTSATIKYGTVNGTYNLNSMPEYKNAGTYTVYFKATAANYNDYTGSVTVTITQKDVSESMIASITTQEYTGNQIKPSITVTDGNPSIITSSDYDISYGENKNVATGGSVTITGKGNYKGTATKTFEIANVILKGTKTDYSGIYDGKSHTGKVTVTNSNEAVIKYGEADGIYDLDTIPEYKNAGSYTVYFKATADNYSPYTGEFTVNIAQKELSDSMIGDISDKTYEGTQIKPEITISDGSPSIISSADYDVDYGANLNVSDGGSVTVTGKGNYTGSIVKNFNIKKAELNISAENKTVTYGESVVIPINYTGFVGGETKDNLLSEAKIYGISEFPDAGEYDIIIGDAKSDNYDITYGDTAKLTVNKKDISISGLNVFDKVYDGEKTAVINETTVVISDVLAGDVVILDLSGATAEFASSDIADNVSVTISGLAIKGDDAENYNLTNAQIITSANIKSNITAEYIAGQITKLSIDRYSDTIVFPTVPEGYTVTLKSSSDETVIDAGGKIYSQDVEKSVDLVFTVSNADGTESFDTATITVTVPAKEKRTVTLLTDENGTVAGAGEYYKKSEVTVSATANTGYEFDGWYEGNTLVSQSSNYKFTLEKDIVLTAKFKIKTSHGGGGGSSVRKYTVKFDSDGGNNIASITVMNGNVITGTNIPIKEGYTFDGWYYDKEFTKPYNKNDKITSSVTLYAKWIENKKEDEEKKDNTEYKSTFTDVNDSDWFCDAVKFVCESGLFKGVSETEFAPNDNLTRGMLVTVLYRAEKEPEITKTSSFTDVKDGDYFKNAVIWAENNHIVSGYSKTEFAPNDNITREQIAVILYRYAQSKELTNAVAVADVSRFKDYDKVSDWAVDAMNYCISVGLIKGDENNNLNPKNGATRAETASILMRYFTK